MREKVETAFLDWQAALPEDQRHNVEYEEFDGRLHVVFVERKGDFAQEHFTALEKQLQETIDPLLLVSSVVVRKQN